MLSNQYWLFRGMRVCQVFCRLTFKVCNKLNFHGLTSIPKVSLKHYSVNEALTARLKGAIIQKTPFMNPTYFIAVGFKLRVGLAPEAQAARSKSLA